MSHPYKHTVQCLQEAVNKEFDMLAALYSPDACHNRAQLQNLMDRELGELIKIKIEISKLSKEAILTGMQMDGVKYPSILWAEEIGPKLQGMMFHSLHDQAPVATADAEGDKRSSTAGNGKQTVTYVVTAAGVVMAITGLILNPVNLLLLSLGIVLTSTGGVLLVKEVYFDRKSLAERKPSVIPDSSVQNEARQTAELLKKILLQNRNVLADWNQKLGVLAVEAMRKMEAGDKA